MKNKIISINILPLLLHTVLCAESSIVSPGAFRIIGTFPINYKDGLNANAVLCSEYFKYVIGKINKEEYPGLDFFGYDIYDTSSSEPSDALTSTAVEILLNNKFKFKQVNGTCACVPRNPALYKTIGIVGPQSSPNAVHLNYFLSIENIPLVSYAATSTDLSFTENFYRTIPSDDNQALFIKDMLVRYNWTYVVTMASDDVHGISGVDILADVLQNNGICISMKLTFHHKERLKMKDVFAKLNNQNLSNVVVVWGLKKSVQQLLQEADGYGIRDFVWIVNEVAALTKYFESSANRLPGTFLSVVYVGGQDKEFQSHFLSLKQKDVESLWLTKLFQKYNIKDNQTLGVIKDVFDFSFIGTIHDAVLVFARALELYLKEKPSCNDKVTPSCFHQPIYDHAEFNKQYLDHVNFKKLDGSTFKFSDSGETSVAKYDLYVSRKKTSTTAEVNFELFTSWERELNKTSKILVRNNTMSILLQNITSKCSDECSSGFYPVFDGISTCCWVCVPCRKNHVKNVSGLSLCVECPLDTVPDSNKTHCLTLTRDQLDWTEWRVVLMLSLAFIGTILVLLFVITFKCFINTPIVRSSNIGLSCIQLAAHFLIFLTPLTFVGMETIYKCQVRLHSSGLLFSVVFCISLIKVTHLLKVFNSKIKMTTKEIRRQKTKEIGLLIFLLLIHASVVIGLHQSYPITTTSTKYLDDLTIHNECIHLETHYIVQLVYLFFLQTLCGIQAFRGRNLPGRFNEAKYTFFAMFISTILAIIGVPLAKSMHSQKEENFVIAMITMIENLSLFVILYGYKVKLILFYPEENTSEIFQRHRMKKILNSREARCLSRASNIDSDCNPRPMMSRSTETILSESSVGDIHKNNNNKNFPQEIRSNNKNDERRTYPIFIIYFKNR